ncbi:hypothetical protein PICMEDRAFT_16282 [Pichia membranifaciens NRRL Y-2026]|uniref:Mitochondrial carrier protein n=1 Tax=Pichia membranifaciens NRRL Y-2026 TaxID=763406 RepID=A0A1E3NJS5_9ASCO|nr:hypothetical protein PICMEDRAFT_16282 [Pichia membranifaciens NRRL Y-2026]ODQ46392.1 hypothetical protein PICMEDRAFT_16282 [Pichia membranifaciens NRRL Y-2026]
MGLTSEIAGAIEENGQMFENGAELEGGALPTRPPMSVDLTLSQRMLSACTGSLLTSLVVTPFDVVRIRLQQQELLYPIQTQDATCCRKVFWELSTTEMVGSLKGNFCQPNSCLNEGAKLDGAFQGLRKIAAQEGISTLYRGLGLTLVMAIPSNVVYFSGYEFLRDSSPVKDTYPMINPLLCGSIARVLAATSVAPLELIKTRIQAVPTGNNKTSASIFRMVIRNSLQEIKHSGISTVFKGLGLTLWRDVPFSGIYWSTYEYITHALKTRTIMDDSNHHIGTDTALFLRSFIGGSLAGVTAAIFTNPFDVGKTRMQVSFEDDQGPNSLVNRKKHKKSIFKFIEQIYKTEGFSALYVGLVPRCMKIAPACAIMISSYEMTKKFFKDKSS